LHAALLKKSIDDTFGNNLLTKSKVKATNVRGTKFKPEYMIDENKKTYYAGKDGSIKSEITFTLQKQSEFDCLMIQEVSFGDRNPVLAII